MRDRQAARSEPYANVYDVFGFVLQLLQMTPIISACLAPLIANSWLVRSLTFCSLLSAGSAPGTRGTAPSAGPAARQARQAARTVTGPDFPEARVVHRVRVSPEQHIAHCSCRAHPCPRVGVTGAVAMSGA